MPKRRYDQLIEQLMAGALDDPRAAAQSNMQTRRRQSGVGSRTRGPTVNANPIAAAGPVQLSPSSGSPAGQVSIPRPNTIPQPTIAPVPSSNLPALGNQLVLGGGGPNWTPGGMPMGGGGAAPGTPQLPSGAVQATYTRPSMPALPAGPSAIPMPAAPPSAGASPGPRITPGASLGGGASRVANVANVADDAAAAATRGGLLAGLNRGTLIKAGTRGGLAGLGATLAADFLVPDVDNTSVDSGARGALTGAAMGATAGSIIPGVGTAIGAGVGGLAGGLIGLFGPKDDAGGQQAVTQAITDNQAKLDQVLAQFDLSEQTRDELAVQLQIGLMNAGGRKDVDAVYDGLADTLPALIQQDRVYKAEEQEATQRAARAAAMQAMLMPAVERANAQSMSTAQELAAIQQQAAGHLTGPLAEIYRTGAAQLPQQVAERNRSALLQLALADAAYGQQADLYRQQQQAAQVPNTNDLIAQLLNGQR